VQMGAMELHPWGSRAESLEFADYLVFDLDPGPRVTWKSVIAAARLLRDELRKVDLQAFVRTSGGKGLHVVTPLMPGVDWDSAKQLAKTIAAVVAAREPNKYVTVMTKSKRPGRIFIDYLRNGRGATAIANYSTRARPGGPVATPLRWSELASITSGSQFTVADIKQRLAQLRNDPWKDFRLPAQ
ncbi:MAG: ATP-dependent DNA ligase, partial [Planctomycetaceae bacterium]|nr:ATP-dependent DNA ligase [Planctomycetaceae bacterium]